MRSYGIRTPSGCSTKLDSLWLKNVFFFFFYVRCLPNVKTEAVKTTLKENFQIPRYLAGLGLIILRAQGESQ